MSAAIGAPDDDVALLLIETDGTGGVPGRVACRAVVATRDAAPATRWLERRGCGEARTADVVLAVSEACNNAIEHAYADRDGTFRVNVMRLHATITAVVEDQGSWRETEPSGEQGRGRGVN